MQGRHKYESIPSSIRLAVTLRFLATGDSYNSFMYTLKISVTKISHIIPEVCNALIQVSQKYIKINILKEVHIYSPVVIWNINSNNTSNNTRNEDKVVPVLN
jgi:hypothetical protein